MRREVVFSFFFFLFFDSSNLGPLLSAILSGLFRARELEQTSRFFGFKWVRECALEERARKLEN
jgi:hypothetical protein